MPCSIYKQITSKQFFLKRNSKKTVKIGILYSSFFHRAKVHDSVVSFGERDKRLLTILQNTKRWIKKIELAANGEKRRHFQNIDVNLKGWAHHQEKSKLFHLIE